MFSNSLFDSDVLDMNRKFISSLLIKKIFILLILGFSLFSTTWCCSMFKLSLNGKTMVGNNEDFWNPNTYMWSEQGKNKEYGAIYFGYDNLLPQGGINQAGLVFDGFGQNYLVIKDTLGKLPLDHDFIKKIMKTCSNVDQVRKYLSQHNLSGLEKGMLFFVDKSGKYLIAEGDSLILGNKEHYVVSNFYPSLVSDESTVPIPFYQKGRKLLESRRDTSVSFCTSVLDSMHQEKVWGFGTQYSTIYDLNDGTIYLYCFRDYTRVLKFNINEELEKDNYSVFIPELFPNNIPVHDFLGNYNSILKDMDLLGTESIIKDSIQYTRIANNLLSNDRRLIRVFSDKIFAVGWSWIDKKDYNSAIIVFSISIKLTPDSWRAYAILADTYMRSGQHDLALKNYEKSVALNPEFTDGKKQIDMLKDSY